QGIGEIGLRVRARKTRLGVGEKEGADTERKDERRHGGRESRGPHEPGEEARGLARLEARTHSSPQGGIRLGARGPPEPRQPFVVAFDHVPASLSARSRERRVSRARNNRDLRAATEMPMVAAASSYESSTRSRRITASRWSGGNSASTLSSAASCRCKSRSRSQPGVGFTTR